MQWHERGGIKLYCLERMQLKERKKKEGGLYDKMLWTKFKVELDGKHTLLSVMTGRLCCAQTLSYEQDPNIFPSHCPIYSQIDNSYMVCKSYYLILDNLILEFSLAFYNHHGL